MLTRLNAKIKLLRKEYETLLKRFTYQEFLDHAEYLKKMDEYLDTVAEAKNVEIEEHPHTKSRKLIKQIGAEFQQIGDEYFDMAHHCDDEVYLNMLQHAYENYHEAINELSFIQVPASINLFKNMVSVLCRLIRADQDKVIKHTYNLINLINDHSLEARFAGDDFAISLLTWSKELISRALAPMHKEKQADAMDVVDADVVDTDVADEAKSELDAMQTDDVPEKPAPSVEPVTESAPAPSAPVTSSVPDLSRIPLVPIMPITYQAPFMFFYQTYVMPGAVVSSRGLSAGSMPESLANMDPAHKARDDSSKPRNPF